MSPLALRRDPGRRGVGFPTDRRYTGQREEVTLGGGGWSSKGVPPAAGNSMVAAPSQRDWQPDHLWL